MDISIQVSRFLQLQLLREADAAALFSCIQANRQHLRRWVSRVDQVRNQDDTLRLIQAGTERLHTQQGLMMGIFEECQLVGLLEMHDWQHDLKKARIGYWLIKEAEGKGIMAQAATAFIDYLFRQADLHKIELTHLPDNTRSAALAERLGFKIEGIIRDAVLLHGQYCHKVIQGLLRKEWPGKRAQPGATGSA